MCVTFLCVYLDKQRTQVMQGKGLQGWNRPQVPSGYYEEDNLVIKVWMETPFDRDIIRRSIPLAGDAPVARVRIPSSDDRESRPAGDGCKGLSRPSPEFHRQPDKAALFQKVWKRPSYRQQRREENNVPYKTIYFSQHDLLDIDFIWISDLLPISLVIWGLTINRISLDISKSTWTK